MNISTIPQVCVMWNSAMFQRMTQQIKLQLLQQDTNLLMFVDTVILIKIWIGYHAMDLTM